MRGGPPRRKLVSPGSIDKFEFAALAEEIEQNYKRRSVLTAVAAAVGAVIVAKSSEEYAIVDRFGIYVFFWWWYSLGRPGGGRVFFSRSVCVVDCKAFLVTI